MSHKIGEWISDDLQYLNNVLTKNKVDALWL